MIRKQSIKAAEISTAIDIDKSIQNNASAIITSEINNLENESKEIDSKEENENLEESVSDLPKSSMLKRSKSKRNSKLNLLPSSNVLTTTDVDNTKKRNKLRRASTDSKLDTVIETNIIDQIVKKELHEKNKIIAFDAILNYTLKCHLKNYATLKNTTELKKLK